VQDLAHDQSHKIAPYMLHINHLLCNKVVSFHRLAQIDTDNQNPFNRQLSKRELEVLRWTADGKTADEIAIALSISARTINFHLAQIMNVLDVPNKTAAVAKAIINGYLF
jgi:LuxR family transcriptional regulator, quorum-sensing system regulator SolR